ncbi:MAG: Acetamidase/Formamidase family protein [Candidatus Bathyarchaeota archaeon BA1]|nr:MAG: Acetamidase/Formamidase family protein [Candidatus Bathyarchaeota archaeon BA1]
MVRRIRKTPFEELSFINNCTLGPLNKPVATVKPGEVFEVETWDALSNTLKPTQTLKDILDRGVSLYKNPVTGPIYVEGAESGDTLAIEIIDISVPHVGVTVVVPGSGGLEGWLQASPPLTKFSKIEDGKAVYTLNDGRQIVIPIKPFIGTIGVSPPSEAISTVTPGKHGGNMDTPDTCAGNRLYLPVSVRGALLGLGDVHAVQGDGEICGTAIEVPSIVKMKIDLIKNKRIDWPRIESPDDIATVCSARPLEDAVRLAFLQLIKWLEEDYGFERYDAYMFLSLAAKIRVSQIVDPLFTVVARLPKALLPSKHETAMAKR